MVATATDPYDIFSHQATRNHGLYEQMRNEDPIHLAIHPDTGQKTWFLTRYDDCLDFLKDKRFGKESHRLPSQSLANDAEDIVNQHMLNLDEPAHARLKSLVHLAFTPNRVAHMRIRIQVIADSLFDAIDIQVADGDELDLTERYIVLLPLRSIADMLGIPVADYHALHLWTSSLLSSDKIVVSRSIDDFSNYLHGQFDLRRDNPDYSDDLLSALVLAEEAGDKLNRKELLAMIYLLTTAGYETMVNFVSNAIMSLFENPEQLQLLQENIDNPLIVNSAIEEMLRYNGPAHMTLASRAFETVEMRGKMIHRGDTVHAVLLAANRDPLVFEAPHIFDILRKPNRHIAFSYGIHHCLGAALARLEGDIAISTLLRRIPNL